MKKTILSAVALVAFGFAAQAQETTSTEGGFNQGDSFITGSVGFGSTKTGDVKSNTFTVSPKAAYFVTSNIALGVSIGYTSMKEEAPATPDETTNTFAAGVFGRYYFTPASKFSLFAQLGAGYQTEKTEIDMAGVEDQKSNGFNIGFAPGINYFVSDHFSLEATFGILGYNTMKPDADGAESTDEFNIGLDMSSINFGLLYKF